MRKRMNLRRRIPVLCTAALLALTAGCSSSSSGKYTAGTYTGTGTGMNGEVTATITVDTDEITAVELGLDNETPSIGQAAGEELIQQILDSQSADIDGVTGATYTSNGVQEAVQDALNQAMGVQETADLSIPDGTYEGTANGHGGPLTVSVTVQNNQITAVEVTSNQETANVADYAMTHIPEEIVSQQTLAVDAVTGSTVTSRAVLAAVADAIDQAGGDSAAWEAQPYEKEVTTYSDMETTLVVAGAGIGGLSTAAFAAERGIPVIVLEKNDVVGGSLRYAGGGFAIANSEHVTDEMGDDSLENIMAWVHQLNDDTDAQNPIDEDFVEYLLSQSGPAFDEMLDMTGTEVTFTAPDPYMRAGFSRGAATADTLAQYVLDHGGQILTGVTVTGINMDGDTAVGLTAENENGSFTVSADYVVIATGGASYTKEDLLEEVTPSLANVHVYNEANVGNTGDGYDMLEAVGASFDGHDVYKNGFYDFADSLYITWANQPETASTIIINADGERFYSEWPFDRGMMTTKMLEEGSGAYYILYDAVDMDADFRAQLDALEEDSSVYVTGADIEELAQKLSIDPDTLQATVDRYNGFCQSGVDEDFGKDAAYLQEYTGEEGYYAVYTMPGSWGTMGGVNTNREMLAEKEDGTYFPNLYAVGEISTGQLFSEYYMGGFSLSYYMTEGNLVAQDIASKM